MVSYKPLWKLLIEKDMKKGDLCKLTRISPTTLAKLNRGENVGVERLEKICKVLDCDIGDIVRIEEDK